MDSPYTIITRDLSGDLTTLTAEQQVQAVLDLLAVEFNPANKLDELNNKVTEVNQAIEKANEVVTKLEQTNQVILKVVIKQNDLSEQEQADLINQFDEYKIGHDYQAGDIFSFEGQLFEVIQDHTSQADWLPGSTASLYKAYLNINIDNADGTVTEIINDFVQPTGSHDTYAKGDKVVFEGQVYESVIDNNAYSPSAYPQGWAVML